MTRPDQLVDAATESIREAIVSGRLRPGMRLVQQQLAEELGISRTPLREALRRLEQQGLVTMMGTGGLAVTELSPEGMLDAYDVREVLDALAARLAAERMAPGEFADLQAIHRRSQAHVDDWNPDGWLAANTAFHRRILSSAHSPALDRAMPAGRVSGQLLFPGVFLHPDRARQAYEEHGRILDALHSGDVEAAAAEAGAHVARVKAALAAQVEQSINARPRRLQLLRRVAGE